MNSANSLSIEANVTVIVRSAGERTIDACMDAVLAQGLPENNVTVISESPFSKAMRVGFESGIAAGRPWTFCIDADVILRPNAIKVMLSRAAKCGDNIFEIQALALDKLSLSLREVGNHFFRTAHLEKMISAIPEEGTALRPEAEAMRRVAKQGLRWAHAPYVIGIHDFEQYNRDIFRKCVTHSQKHLHLLPKLVPLVRSLAESDPDFSIALHGFAEGIRTQETVRIDKNFVLFGQRFEELQLPEKKGVASITTKEVEIVLQTWCQDKQLTVRGWPVSPQQAIAMDARTEFSQLKRLLAILRMHQKEIGTIKMFPYAIGAGAEQFGRTLKAIAAR